MDNLSKRLLVILLLVAGLEATREQGDAEPSAATHSTAGSWDGKGPRLIIPPQDSAVAIHGPLIVGATPGRPFLFRVPATGARPLSYSATNLPAGLHLDSKTGIISGSLLGAGSTKAVIFVRGNSGSAQRALTIVGGEHMLALTPPMGWNSWNAWQGKVDQEKVSAAGQELISTGLADHGYQYVNIDDTWEECLLPTIVGRYLRWYLPTYRDAQGNIYANGKFPDLRGLCDELHGEGLKAGIYSSPGPKTCGGYIGSYQHEAQDAQTFANYGFDYLKYDWCSYGTVIQGDNSLAALQKPYQIMGASLQTTGRDIVYSLCQYGMGDVWKWGADPGIDANCWRTHEDIVDAWTTSSHNGVYDIIEAQAGLEKYAGPGHWNDPDMLMVGIVRGRDYHPTNLTPDEQIAHISMWCLLAAPMLIGCDMAKLDPFTLALLSNDEVLDVDQDPLGKQAARIRQDGQGGEVWARELFDGTRAVGLLNSSSAAREMEVRWSEIGLDGSQPVRDLWLHQDAGFCKGSYSVLVPSHGIVLLKIGRADSSR